MNKEISFNLQNEISGAKNFHTVIFTTFNFDIEYFETNVLNTLIGNKLKEIVIYVDYTQFQNSIKNYKPRYLGTKYILKLVNINFSFHPKLILFLSDERAKLIVGSGNLTYNGHKINSEVFNYVDYIFGKKENAKTINQAIEFVKGIDDLSFGIDYNWVKQYLNSIPTIKTEESIDERLLLHNLETPILEQIKNLIDDDIIGINIAVPYYDNELSALSEIIDTFHITPNIYLQNLKCSFPIKHNESKNIIHTDFMKIVYRINRHEKFYHGKVFLFKGKKHDYIVYGSANCTSAALLKNMNSGNVEIDFMEIGNINEFDNFFKLFEKDPNQVLQCEKLNFKQEVHSKYSYLFGSLKDNIFKCQVKTNNKNISSITINNIKTTFRFLADNTIEIQAKLTENIEDTCLLDLEIMDFENKEYLSAWFIHFDKIKSFISGSKEENDVFSINELNIKNQDFEVYRMILNRMKLNFEEQLEYKTKEQNHKNDEDQESEFEEDYILDFIPTSSFEYEHKQQKHIYKLIRKSLYSHHRNLGEVITYTKRNNSSEVKNHLPEDINFARYFKSRIKYISKRNYYSLVDINQYLNNIHIICEVINGLSNKGLLLSESPLIPNHELSQFLSEIIYILISKNLDELETTELEYVLRLSIRMVLLNLETENTNSSEMNKKIINRIDTYFEIFNILDGKIKSLLDEYYSDDALVKHQIRYLETLLERKSYEYIKRSISKQYGKAQIEIIDDFLIIKDIEKARFPTTSSDDLIKQSYKIFKKCGEHHIVDKIKYFRFDKIDNPNDKENFIISTIVDIRKPVLKKKYYRKNGSLYPNDWIHLK